MQAYTVELQEEGEAVEDQGTPQWQVYAFYAIILVQSPPNHLHYLYHTCTHSTLMSHHRVPSPFVC